MARYIDADALRTALELERIGTDFFCGYGFKRAIWHIQHTPTANVAEVKHGRWEKRTFVGYGGEIKHGYHCSECSTTWDEPTNHCPNCGAKMDGKG